MMYENIPKRSWALGTKKNNQPYEQRESFETILKYFKNHSKCQTLSYKIPLQNECDFISSKGFPLSSAR